MRLWHFDRIGPTLAVGQAFHDLLDRKLSYELRVAMGGKSETATPATLTAAFITTFPSAPLTTSAYTTIDSAGSRSTDSTAIAADFVFATDAGDPANQSIFKRESEDLSQ
ncbi:hypothetical protein GBA52_026054, partial [Prunus armeniaca]